MEFLRKLSDNSKPSALANRFRNRRFERFKSLYRPEKGKKSRILDIGGTVEYWLQHGESLGQDIEVEVLNLYPQEPSGLVKKSHEGDAVDLSQFANQEFDLVYSNSVIEHITESSQQKLMAEEVARVGRCFWVQTPNYFFPFEPHFLFPCFQFLPRGAQLGLVQKFRLGWTQKAESREEAEVLVDSVRLLRPKEMAAFFPEAKLEMESFLGLPKSIVAYRM